MPSDRVQRRIDRLLDRAEDAADHEDWTRVRELAQRALTLDDANADALAFQSMAADGRGGAADAGSPRSPTSPLVNVGRLPPPPASFVSGRYEVRGLLGQGAHKLVYRARDTRLDRDVAFALIKTEGLDAPGRERILREAQASLSSAPQIVTVYDTGEEDGPPLPRLRIYGWRRSRGHAARRP